MTVTGKAWQSKPASRYHSIGRPNFWNAPWNGKDAPTELGAITAANSSATPSRHRQTVVAISSNLPNAASHRRMPISTGTTAQSGMAGWRTTGSTVRKNSRITLPNHYGPIITNVLDGHRRHYVETETGLGRRVSTLRPLKNGQFTFYP